MAFTPSTQQDMLSVLDRVLPDSYLSPLKRGLGPGYEVLQAAAATMARCSAAVGVLDQQASLGTATGGSYATAQVQFTRPTAATGALVIKAGTAVTTSATGRDFVLLTDAALGALALTTGPVTVTAVAQSYEYNNCLGPRTAADGTVIPGSIDTILSLVTSPDYADPTIGVSQVADATGGASADLDELGEDLGIPRRVGESDTSYRARLHQLPDTISPGAIQRFVTAQFGPYAALGFPAAAFIETYQLNFCTAWDVPNPATLPGTSPLQPLSANTCFFYDDTRGPTGPNVPGTYYGRWLDINDYRGAFIIVCPLLPSINDLGMFYDDPTPYLAGPEAAASIYNTPLGFRGTSAYDASGLVGPATQGFYDAADQTWQAVYVGLFNQLQAIKAAGVTAEVVIVLPPLPKGVLERFTSLDVYASQQVHSAVYVDGALAGDLSAGLGGRGQGEGALAGDSYTGLVRPGAAMVEGVVAGDTASASSGRQNVSIAEGAIPGENEASFQKAVAGESEGALAGDAYARGFGVSESEGATAGDAYTMTLLPFAQQTDGVVVSDTEASVQNQGAGEAEGATTGDGYDRA